MRGFDFEKGKSFPMSFGLMSSVGEKSKTKKIAPTSRMTFNSGHESFHRGSLATEIILVAINASKTLTRHALEWTLSNAAQPGDRIVLLALLPASSGWKFWKFAKFSPSRERTRIEEAKQSCQFIIEQLQSLCDAKKVQASVKIISNAEKGATTSEAKKVHATWVILDRKLKREEKTCSEQLQCNLVVVDRYNPKILRLNLKHSPKSLAPEDDAVSKHKSLAQDVNTPASSPDIGAPFTPTDRGNSSCSESSTSPFSSTESYQRYQHENLAEKADNVHVEQHVSESDSDDPSVVSRRWRSGKSLRDDRDMRREGRKTSQVVPAKLPAAKERLSSHSRSSTSMREGNFRQTSGPSTSKLVLSDLLTAFKSASSVDDFEAAPDHANVRRAVSLPMSTHSPLEPPPLCSICQHKAPVFGRPPREFTFRELELATGGFSQANFLAEGGFGSVHRGILPEGQVVAVKQHKLASAQGDVEFCSEVEVLSCAQHRNVVMLIGYCIENNRRLLVYEFICNSSLDSHLYGRNREPLEWKYRQRIAVGAARGLRYLHEECRVGCIVHRDMRPNNILLTHDFEPMVGDFGLARWQPDGKLGVETRVIGTFGYLAPEYTQSGQITEKADVYSFGIVLLELVTGRKAIDISRPKGEQCLTEWARPLLRKQAYQELVDPRLSDAFEQDEVRYMLHAAFLCISRDPSMRPRMSQVLRILEGEMTLDVTPTINSQEGSLSDDDRPTTKPASQDNTRRSTSALPSRKNRYVSSFRSGSEDPVMMTSRKLTLDELKVAYRDKLSHRRLSYGDAL